MRFDRNRLSKPPGSMNESEFVEAFGRIYENSPWVARDTWQRGVDQRHDTVEAMAAELAATVNTSDRDSRLALIRAHPDLAGRAAMQGRLGADSTREQAGAGIDQCSEEEYERFHSLNDAYKRKFGFPFVIAVRGSDRQAILSAFAARIGNDEVTEFENAIAEIHKIARLRLTEFAEAPGAGGA
jgi:2-oxo-4-hydroxy-4-carboxy-5-ureidoimidazoline decarboxylase